MAGSDANNEFVNSLRLSDQEAAEIIDALSHNRDHTPGRDRRKQERVAYAQQAGLIIKMHHPGGTVANHLVRVRNLSAGGIGFLHGSFVYTGTRCSMALRSRTNRSVCVEGKVVRCEHVRKHIHEVGLRFEKPIVLGEFIASALRMGVEVETSQELPQLSGIVMYVEDSISDQELLAFHLGNVGVKVKAVADVLAAVELSEQMKFDAILTNVWLPTLSGMELADFLRQKGYKGPIIAMTADGRPQVKEEVARHGVTGVLVKPYHFEELFSMLEPHLRRGQSKPSDEMMMSELWADERMRPLIRTFLARLRNEIREMERLVSIDKSGAVLRKLCMDVKGSAGGYGFGRISLAAHALLDLLMDGVEGERLHAAFNELAELSRSACLILDDSGEAAAKPAEAASNDAKAA